MSKSLPARADVVIVGGGIVGASIAYHLGKVGIANTVLLERKQLTSGTTWHAAGLVGQLRASRNLTELAKYTTSLFEGLEKETGQATGFKQNGSISIALSDGRFEELKRGASMAKNFGLAVDVISTAEIKERVPHYNMENVVGGVFLPKDGQVNPIDVTQALAAGARARGAKVFENVKVTRILVKDGKAVGVETADGTIMADKVVIAAGMWSRELGRSIGGMPRTSASADARSASTYRCTPASISTSSPSPSPNCRATCRWCACPTNAPITRKTPAS
jgi:4-methylaminobutanoate oxidase (formaldehyde-forming)